MDTCVNPYILQPSQLDSIPFSLYWGLMLNMVFRSEATKIMIIINAIVSYSFYKWGNRHSERWPQLLQRNKWQKWNLEKGCVTLQSLCSCHHCIIVLPFKSHSQIYRMHHYSICMHPKASASSPKLCLSHCPRPTLPCLLFSALHSSPLWEPGSWPQPQSEPPCLILASFLPRAQTAAPQNSGPSARHWSSTEVLTCGLPSLRLRES